MANNNKHTGPNVPALRFPEFSGEWENKCLGDISENISSGRTKSTTKEGKYVLIGSTGVIGNTSDADYSGNLILVARVGANAGLINYYSGDCGITDNTLIIKPFEQEKSFCHYVYHYLKHCNLNQFVFGSGQPLITGGMLKRLPIRYGTTDEINKVSSLFDLLDARIEAQSKIIEEQETLLKSLADKLFNTLDTVTKLHLGDISELYQPKTIPLSNLSSKGYPVYGANGIIGSYKNFNHITEQICIACRGSSCGSVNYTVPKAWITGNAMVVNTDNYSNIIDKRYLYYYLRRINYSSLISGSGQPQIVRAPLANLLIPVPTLEKQKHVVLILETVAKILGTNKIILLHYQNQKAYLLSHMFI